jgi:hypothetical protein
MIPRYRFKNAQTRSLFCELARNPDIPPATLRAIAHISPRIPEGDWNPLFQNLLARLLGKPDATGALRLALAEGPGPGVDRAAQGERRQP